MAGANHNYWQTDRIRLRVPEPGDAELLHAWSQDSETMRNFAGLRPPRSLAATKKWLENAATEESKNDELTFLIENEQSQPVGMIGANRTDRQVGAFQLFFMILPGQRRQGYASSAILLLMRYYFEELRYQKCTTNVYSYNTDSQALHQALGFVEEGRLRRTIYARGQYYDELFYGMLAEEFFTRYGAGNSRP